MVMESLRKVMTTKQMPSSYGSLNGIHVTMVRRTTVPGNLRQRK